MSKLKFGQFLRCSPRQVWRELGWQLPLKTARFSRRTSQAAQISRRIVQCGSININSLLILDKMSNFFPRANVGCSPDCKIHSSKPALLAGSKHSRRLQGQSHYIKLLFLDKKQFFRSKTQYSAPLGLLLVLLGPLLILFGLKNEDQRFGSLRTDSKLLTGSRSDFATIGCTVQSLNDCK